MGARTAALTPWVKRVRVERSRSGDALGAPGAELVVRVGRGDLVLGTLAREGRECALDLLPDPAHGDAEDALATLQQVVDLVGRGALVDARAVAHQGDPGEVLDAAVAQLLDRLADLLERDAGVEQPLDHLEHENVAEPVEPLRAGPGGAAHRGLDQAGAGPVVELTVGDAGRPAGGGTAVADVLAQLWKVVVEEQTLGGRRDVRPALLRVSRDDHGVLLSVSRAVLAFVSDHPPVKLHRGISVPTSRR